MQVDQCTVNDYPAGVGLSPHIDTHSAFTGTETDCAATNVLSMPAPSCWRACLHVQTPNQRVCLPWGSPTRAYSTIVCMLQHMISHSSLNMRVQQFTSCGSGTGALACNGIAVQPKYGSSLHIAECSSFRNQSLAAESLLMQEQLLPCPWQGML